jgi:hypothetical protein
MAKKSTPAQEVKKLTQEELEQLQSLHATQQNILANLGNIEIAKFDMLNEMASVRIKMNEFTGEMQAKYGDVTISIADGVISEEVPAQKPELQVVRPE